MADDALVKDFPGLTHFDLMAARLYYQANRQEIDGLIASHHSNEGWDV